MSLVEPFKLLLRCSSATWGTGETTTGGSCGWAMGPVVAAAPATVVVVPETTACAPFLR